MHKGIKIPEKALRFIRGADYPLPVVLDGNWVNSLGIVRGLGIEGINSVVINHAEGGASFYSKYPGASLICPTPWEEPEEFISFMEKLGENFKDRSVLLVTDDTYLRVLSEGKNRLEEYYRYSFPDFNTLIKIMDKNYQYKTAEKLGIRVPKSECVNNSGDLAKLDNINFPALVKGLEGKEFFRTFGKQVLNVSSRKEILDILDQLPVGKVIVQEQIVGDESNLYSYCCYMDPEGEVKCQFTGRKLHQYPREFGTCSIAKSVECSEIIEPSMNLLRKMGFFGVAQVEYKRKPETGQFYLIEVNARFWKWHSLATACNINFSSVAYFDLINEPYTCSPDQKYGLKWVVFPEEILGAISDLKKKKFKLISWTRKIFPPFVFGLFSIKDPLPWLMMLIHRLLLQKKNQIKSVSSQIFFNIS